MTFVTAHHLRDPSLDRGLFQELSVVELLVAVKTDDGLNVPEGSHGTIAAVYDRGNAYEVEFARPVVGNCTVTADLLRSV